MQVTNREIATKLCTTCLSDCVKLKPLFFKTSKYLNKKGTLAQILAGSSAIAFLDLS